MFGMCRVSLFSHVGSCFLLHHKAEHGLPSTSTGTLLLPKQTTTCLMINYQLCSLLPDKLQIVEFAACLLIHPTCYTMVIASLVAWNVCSMTLRVVQQWNTHSIFYVWCFTCQVHRARVPTPLAKDTMTAVGFAMESPAAVRNPP